MNDLKKYEIQTFFLSLVQIGIISSFWCHFYSYDQIKRTTKIMLIKRRIPPMETPRRTDSKSLPIFWNCWKWTSLESKKTSFLINSLQSSALHSSFSQREKKPISSKFNLFWVGFPHWQQLNCVSMGFVFRLWSRLDSNQ